MAGVPGPYQIHTFDGDRPMIFHTVARNEAEAMRTFRRLHKYWKKPIKIVGPSEPPTTKPTKPKGRKK